ncbi:MAG: DUF1656 domain-containing protein [Desulfobulbus sp.]|nr:DUF1656 domain-containing protein [Desulfobulbus sp.]
MPREVEILGAFVPGLLIVGLLAAVVQVGLDWLCARYGVYRHVWHRSLFRVGMFVCVWGALSRLLIH